MATGRVVKAGAYNRPFLIFKNHKLIITDERAYLKKYKAVSGGSWLIRNGKSYATQDHFTQKFRTLKVNRTFIGYTSTGKAYLIVMKKANFSKMVKLAVKLKLQEAIKIGRAHV